MVASAGIDRDATAAPWRCGSGEVETEAKGEAEAEAVVEAEGDAASEAEEACVGEGARVGDVGGGISHCE